MYTIMRVYEYDNEHIFTFGLQVTNVRQFDSSKYVVNTITILVHIELMVYHKSIELIKQNSI